MCIRAYAVLGDLNCSGLPRALHCGVLHSLYMTQERARDSLQWYVESFDSAAAHSFKCHHVFTMCASGGHFASVPLMYTVSTAPRMGAVTSTASCLPKK